MHTLLHHKDVVAYSKHIIITMQNHVITDDICFSYLSLL
jgi:hypothetical protein